MSMVFAAGTFGSPGIVMICGDIMTMPGLPKVPAANTIDIDASGKIVGLF